MKMMFILLMAAALCSGDGTGTNVFRADIPEIRFVGRTVVSQDGSVSFDWSGTYFETEFEGGFCSMRVSDSGRNYYNVFIDGDLHGTVSTFGRDSLVVLAEGMDKGRHTLRLQKRTEAEQGRTTIHGFELREGSVFHSPAGKPVRHIEFIGNSLTCGYGTEGLSKNEPFKAETENCDLAYACICARYFDADYTLIAHSGQGAARNYGDPKHVSDYTMKDRMLRTFDEDRDVMWDFAKSPYKPDVVVVNLGTNDFSDPAPPSREQFTEMYLRIIEQIRSAYPDTPVICIAPLDGQDGIGYIESACRDSGAHYCRFPAGIHNRDSDLGSSYHPNYKGQRKMAMTLIPHISTVTGWELADKPVQ